MRKRTVALKYELDKDYAPRVVAKGERKVADKIIYVARRCGIPVYEDSGLVNSLYFLDIGSFIPEEFYTVVATVLAWVYSLDKGKRLRERGGVVARERGDR